MGFFKSKNKPEENVEEVKPNNIASNYEDEPQPYKPLGKNPDRNYPGWDVEYF